MNTTQINKAFDRNQADAFLADAKVHHIAAEVLVSDGLGKTLAIFDRAQPKETIMLKIKHWCVKNAYRCPQIKNGEILL